MMPYFGQAYTIKAGQAVGLNFISQNVLTCQAKNDYYYPAWGGNNLWTNTANRNGQITIGLGQLSVPGNSTFWYQCQDDDAPFAWLVSWANLTVLPKDTFLGTSSCNAPQNDQATLNWFNVQYADSYAVLITQPPSGCPVGWSPNGGGECIIYHPADLGVSSSITFPTQTLFNYSWRVAARTSGLQGDYSTPGTVFSCIAPNVPMVNLNFLP